MQIYELMGQGEHCHRNPTGTIGKLLFLARVAEGYRVYYLQFEGAVTVVAGG